MRERLVLMTVCQRFDVLRSRIRSHSCRCDAIFIFSSGGRASRDMMQLLLRSALSIGSVKISEGPFTECGLSLWKKDGPGTVAG